ncbi:hypothetical protein [Rhizobium leguminosarum]|uniref:Uncharacterized protein n=1 Tax=Rhizobium leguminosarum TaxID=384 RepID=A0A7M3DW62_RHILE|nr:hypothetical protein [Rhizobium leguminosarum]TAY52929.1 hypothetical protein ELH90_15485 [Rhizobium leguminosarum]
MKRVISFVIAASLAIAISSGGLQANMKLPKNAKALTAEETTRLYVGNTVIWDTDGRKVS